MPMANEPYLGSTYLAFRILFRQPFDFPAEQGRYANDATEYPHERYHEYGPRRRPFFQVVDGLRDGPVPVKSYQTQVHDGRGAQEHVKGGVYVAPPVTKYPIAHQLVGQRKRHDDYTQKKVGNGQTRYEPVLHVLQRFLRHNRYDDQHVAHDHHDHQHDDNDGGEHDLRHRVRRRVNGLEYEVRSPVRIQRAVGVVQITGAVLVNQKSELLLIDFEHQARQIIGAANRPHFGTRLRFDRTEPERDRLFKLSGGGCVSFGDSTKCAHGRLQVVTGNSVDSLWTTLSTTTVLG